MSEGLGGGGGVFIISSCFSTVTTDQHRTSFIHFNQQIHNRPYGNTHAQSYRITPYSASPRGRSSEMGVNARQAPMPLEMWWFIENPCLGDLSHIIQVLKTVSNFFALTEARLPDVNQEAGIFTLLKLCRYEGVAIPFFRGTGSIWVPSWQTSRLVDCHINTLIQHLLQQGNILWAR